MFKILRWRHIGYYQGVKYVKNIRSLVITHLHIKFLDEKIVCTKPHSQSHIRKGFVKKGVVEYDKFTSSRRVFYISL